MLPEEWQVLIKDGVEQKWVNGRLQDGVLMVETRPDQWVPEDMVQVLKKEFVSSPIAQIPLGGYSFKGNFSEISIVWLKWMEHTERRLGNPSYKIRHACSVNGEQRIARPRQGTRDRAFYTVDGFSQQDNTIWEFYGCHFHGCPCKVKGGQRFQPYVRGISAETLYQATLKREQHLRSLGYRVVSIFECEFRKQMMENEDLAAFAKNIHIEGRLNPRDAFFGGRTNAVRLHFKKTGDEVLRYYDITR